MGGKFEDDVIVIIFNKHSMYYKKIFSSIKKREDVKKKMGFFGASRIHSTTSCKMSKNYLIIFM